MPCAQFSIVKRSTAFVLDYNLGTESGFAIKDRLVTRYPVVPPIIMLTGDGREERT